MPDFFAPNERAMFKEFEVRPPTIQACQVTRTNLRDLANVMRATKATVEYIKGTADQVITFWLADGSTLECKFDDYLVVDRTIETGSQYFLMTYRELIFKYQDYVDPQTIINERQARRDAAEFEATNKVKDETVAERRENYQNALYLVTQAHQKTSPGGLIPQEYEELIRRLGTALEYYAVNYGQR